MEHVQGAGSNSPRHEIAALEKQLAQLGADRDLDRKLAAQHDVSVRRNGRMKPAEDLRMEVKEKLQQKISRLKQRIEFQDRLVDDSCRISFTIVCVSCICTHCTAVTTNH